ncbi:hypothetical protein GCM10011383_45780 [Hymenobacter cavernae]|uniref:Secretion system C-terminal sorting domain-containing protein n=1 Tax=Hymenobacter cavernae TaxID=2044852 RepID=A0ABQ1UZ88_9BACT|nr:hypothetical protein GCM10011383_45780 [Hymenobacter cavernae]
MLAPFGAIPTRPGNRVTRTAAGLALGLLLAGQATTALAQEVIPGVIGTDQIVCAGETPAVLRNLTAASGGTGTYAYQWESSFDNTSWTAVAGATGADFPPGLLAVTTYFRRQVTSGAGSSATVTSNVVTVMLLPALTSGSIGADQTLFTGATPAPLTSMAGASGGTGTYTYQWESSADNMTWTAIAGATGMDFAPGPLTATTYFRRRAMSGGCTSISVVVTLRVQPIITSQSAAATTTFTVYPNPATSGRLQLALPLSSSGHATLLNALGQPVLVQDLSAAAEHTLLTSGLPAGVYLLRVATAGRILTRRVALE